MSNHVKSRFQNFASLDIRSLSVFRIFLGLLTVCYFAQARVNWDTFFASSGILTTAPTDFQKWMFWSLFNWLPENLHVPLLYIGIVFALFYTLGIWHRVSATVIFIIMLSIHHRNYLTVQNGYVLQCCLIFWSVFLPLGKIWSKNLNYRVHSWSVLLLIAQVSLLYLFSFLHKGNGIWLWSGDGVFRALSYSPHTRPSGEWLLNFPWLLPFLTWGTQLIRLLGGLALLIPYKPEKIRGFLVVIFIVMHAFFAATLTLGTFSYVCIALWTAFIPSSWWNSKKKPAAVGSCDFGLKAYGSLVLLLILIFTNIQSFSRENFNGGFWPHAMGIAQRWAMFANVGQEHRWLRVLKEDSTGAFTLSPLFPSMPRDGWQPVSSLYPNEMSRRYHEVLINREAPGMISDYADFACRKLEQRGELPVSVVLQIMSTTVEKHHRVPYTYSVKKAWRMVCR